MNKKQFIEEKAKILTQMALHNYRGTARYFEQAIKLGMDNAYLPDTEYSIVDFAGCIKVVSSGGDCQAKIWYGESFTKEQALESAHEMAKKLKGVGL